MRILMLGFLVLGFSSTHAADADLYNLKAPSWSMEVKEGEEGRDRVVFTNNRTKEVVSTWEPSSPFFKMLDSNIIKMGKREFVETLWLHGASSTTIRFFDPRSKSGKPIYERTSSYDASYKVIDESIEVTFYDEVSLEDPTIIEKKETFKP